MNNIAADPGPVAVRPRNVEFNCSGAPLQWIPGHPVSSHFVSAFNLILPECEEWFVRVFSEALGHVDDEILRETMRGFIGQEAQHSRVHGNVLDTFFAENGVDTTEFTGQMRWVFRRVLRIPSRLSARRRRKHLISQLWLIAAIEHFTAIFGDFLLNNSWEEYGAHPGLVDIYRWHGAEEVEHRCVAHDVATYFGDGPLRRFWAMLAAFPLIISVVIRGVHLINTGENSGAPKSEIAMWRALHADAELGLAPDFGRVLRSVLTFVGPGYNPEDVGSTAQAVAYLSRMHVTRVAS